MYYTIRDKTSVSVPFADFVSFTPHTFVNRVGFAVGRRH